MPQNTHIELIEAEVERVPQGASKDTPDFRDLRRQAEELAGLLAWNPSVQTSAFFTVRWNAMAVVLRPLLERVERDGRSESETDDHRWLRENATLLWSRLSNTQNAFKPLNRLPHVSTPRGITIPRTAGVAEAFLHAVDFQFSEETFIAYLGAYQNTTVLKFGELWALIPSLELVLLEQTAARGQKALENPEAPQKVGVCVRSLRDISQLHWKDVLDAQIGFDKVLRDDPAGAYSRMDFDSRDMYRARLVKIAENSDSTEMEVAHAVVALARNAEKQSLEDPRQALRLSHIGYYLIGPGQEQLHARVGFRPPFGWRIRHFLRTHPDEFYLPGIEILTFGIMSAVVLLLTSTNTPPSMILFAMLLLLLPSSQSAVQVMNYLTTALLRPEILPKLDFSKEVPEACTTLVAVPALLLKSNTWSRALKFVTWETTIPTFILRCLPILPIPRCPQMKKIR
jgi:cyclic beta-1,2-glucan synthetase